MNAEQWIDRFAAAAGAEAPSGDDFDAVLELASVAAHGSERKAAPLACWIAGRAGLDLAEARRIAERIDGAEGG